MRVSTAYDNADELLLLANLTSTGTTLSSFNYVYDGIGNRTRATEADGSVVTWNYDPTYQLTNEHRSGATTYNITYTYDAVGNRTLMVNNGAPDDLCVQCGQRACDEPNQRWHDDLCFRWKRQSSDIARAGQPVDDQHLGRRESVNAGGAAYGNHRHFHVQR